jgi:hypothetical protein
VAAKVRWLAEVRDAAAIPAVLALPVVSGAPVMVLGEGSNVLFAADFPGLILRTAFDSVGVLGDDGSTALVRRAKRNLWSVDRARPPGSAALVPGSSAPVRTSIFMAPSCRSIETIRLGSADRSSGDWLRSARSPIATARSSGLDDRSSQSGSVWRAKLARGSITPASARTRRTSVTAIRPAGVMR